MPGESGECRIPGCFKEAEELILRRCDAVEDAAILKNGNEAGFLAAEDFVSGIEEGAVLPDRPA